MASLTVIAVDWSGSLSDARRKMWLAEACEGRLLRLEGGRDRNEIVAFLADRVSKDRNLVVGLDFAFSTPAWFLEELGVGPKGLWKLAADAAENWLQDCEPPFWGRRKTKRPELPDHLRLTDHMTVAGISPKSVFQVGGAGQVGTGSVRGWPHLVRLQEAGFNIYPFDEGVLPLIVEIYPRSLTGAVNKSSVTERRRYLAERFSLSARNLDDAAGNDDAFDAAVSALVMSEHSAEFTGLPRITEERLLSEGVIWLPRDTASAAVSEKLPEVIETDRLRLRLPTIEDAPAVFEAITGDKSVMRLYPVGLHTRISETKEFLRERLSCRIRGDCCHWLVIDAETEKILGIVGLGLKGHSAEVGVAMSRHSWGKGYASEALRAVIDASASLPHIRRLWAWCDVENLASCRALEKVGLTFEGHLRHYAILPNMGSEPRDSYVYGFAR